MNQKKQEMIETAMRRHQKIFPCISRTTLDDCFTVEGDRILFWYNTEDHSTHIVASSLA